MVLRPSVALLAIAAQAYSLATPPSLFARAPPTNLANYQDSNGQTVSYQGCFTDSAGARVLTGTPATGITQVTVQNCAFACSQANYPVSGTEYSGECYCGNAVPTSATATCNMACAGDANTICGGANAISVYQQTLLSAQQNALAADTSVTYVGCGSFSGSAITTSTNTAGTIDFCAARAILLGYRTFTVTNSLCYFYTTAAAITTPSTTCTVTCTGASLKYCGSASAGVVQLYSVASTNVPMSTASLTTANGQPFTFVNCYSDNAAGRTLTNNVLIASVTPVLCASACANQGYTYAGLEVSSECWCGNTITTSITTTGCINACKGDATTSCGGANALQVYQAGTITTGFSATSPNARGEVVSFLGCFADNSASLATRLFPLRLYPSTITPTACTTACSTVFALDASSNPIYYAYAGLQYGSECWCSSTAPSGTAAISQIQCTQMKCSGDANSWCGGGNKMVVYKSTQASPISSLSSYTVSNSYGTATYLGCYSTASGVTPSQYTAITSGWAGLNVELCITSCSKFGFAYAGVQGVSATTASCVCSQTVSLPGTPGGTCNVPCPGAPGEQCGGYSGSTSSTSVYRTNTVGLARTVGSSSTFATTSTTASTFIGCYIDSVVTRVLSTQVSLGTTLNSPSACIDKCTSMGFSLAGVEFGVECWCGSTLPAPWTGYPSNTAAGMAGDCNMTCPGANTQTCGAGNRVAIFSNGGTITAPTILTTVSDPALTVNGVATTFSHLGCYPDYYPVSRTIANFVAISVSGGTSPTTCAITCFNLNYKYAAVEFGSECYCSNTISANQAGNIPSAVSTSPSPCNMPCKGNSAYFCGGSNYLNLYVASGATSIPASVAVTVGGSTVTWTYQMCYREPTGGRAMSAPINNPSKTIASCLTLASNSSPAYTACGLEYGGECWCNVGLPTTGTQIAEGYCGSYTNAAGNVVVAGMVCTGNTLQYCGAGNVMAIFTSFAPSPAITKITTSPT